MNTINKYLLAIIGAVILTVSAAGAQEAGQNSIESMTVAEQGGVINVKLTFKNALTAPPSGFSVAKPARIALDLKKSGFVPDVMAGHNGWGEIWYLKDVFPSTPLLPRRRRPSAWQQWRRKSQRSLVAPPRESCWERLRTFCAVTR